jgi:hypothetical protein
LTSAVVFPAYGFTREFEKPANSLCAAALAGLSPGGVYSALVMEENLDFPLFVLSCWLSFRVLRQSRIADALWCALALCLTVLMKPLGPTLAAAYAMAAAAWTSLEYRWRDSTAERWRTIAIRRVPLIMLGAVMIGRRILVSASGDFGSVADVLVSRF